MDDGVGWYISGIIQKRFGNIIDIIQADQLSVEMVDNIADRSLIIFVDAHISDEDDWIKSVEITPDSNPGLITHIIKPANLLAFCLSIHNKSPKAYLYSVKGTIFDFGEELSEQTHKSADETIEIISHLISNSLKSDN